MSAGEETGDKAVRGEEEFEFAVCDREIPGGTVHDEDKVELGIDDEEGEAAVGNKDRLEAVRAACGGPVDADRDVLLKVQGADEITQL